MWKRCESGIHLRAAGAMLHLPRIVRGEGAWLFTDDGRRILDAISSWWVNLHGHAHPKIANAIAEQARQLEHVLLAGFVHEPVERLAEELRRVVPAELKHMFFSDDGSTAVEVALKMAVQYWRNVGRPEKSEIVCAGTRISRRYGGRDVCERRFAIYGGVRSECVFRCIACIRRIAIAVRSD